MEIKTISYQRVLNLGNYESKRLEMFAELHPGDDVEAQTFHLMTMVERGIREDAARQVEDEISRLKQELRELKQEIKQQINQGINAITSPNQDTSGSEGIAF